MFPPTVSNCWVSNVNRVSRIWNCFRFSGIFRYDVSSFLRCRRIKFAKDFELLGMECKLHLKNLEFLVKLSNLSIDVSSSSS